MKSIIATILIELVIAAFYFCNIDSMYFFESMVFGFMCIMIGGIVLVYGTVFAFSEFDKRPHVSGLYVEIISSSDITSVTYKGKSIPFIHIKK